MRQLLSAKFDTVESIPGHLTEKQISVGLKLSTPDVIEDIESGKGGVVSRVRWKIDRYLGARRDYIDESDPSSSAKQILDRNQSHPALEGLCRSIQSADAVVVDGDGSLVLRDQPGRMLHLSMAIIHLSNHFNTPVHYVNSIFSDSSVTGRNEQYIGVVVDALRMCSTVMLRDPVSVDLLREAAPDIACEMVPDSLFAWFDQSADWVQEMPLNGDMVVPHGQETSRILGSLDFSGDYICISGGSRAAGRREEAKERYTSLVEKIKTLGYPVYLVPTCRGDAFLEEVSRRTNTPMVPVQISVSMGTAILANARLLLSGRYHPSIMAALGGTPCVFFQADSHKALSLQRLLGYETPKQFSAAPSPDELDALLKEAQDLLGAGEDLRCHLKSHAEKQYLASLKLPGLVYDATVRATGRVPVKEASVAS